MKKTITILLLFTLLLTPFAFAQIVEIEKDSPLKSFFNNLFSNFFATGYTGANIGCNSLATQESNYEFNVNMGKVDGLIGEPIYAYSECSNFGNLVGVAGFAKRVGTVRDDGSRQDAEAWGGFGCSYTTKSYLSLSEPATLSEIRGCIPDWTDPDEVVEIPTATPVSSCSTSDLRITSRTYDSNNIDTGLLGRRKVPITVNLMNFGDSTVSGEFVECGIYPTSSVYIQTWWKLLSFTRFAGNCVATEDNVQTVEVVDLAPDEQVSVTLSPYTPQGVSSGDSATVICGVYTACGSYGNSCGVSDVKDER